MNSIKTHPIRIRDIETFRLAIGLTIIDMCWLLGVLPTKWGTMMRDLRLNPDHLADTRHALIIRWLIPRPDQTPTLFPPSVEGFWDRLRNTVGTVSARAFSVNLGWDSTAASRWQTRGGVICPSGRRILALLDHHDPKVLAANWAEWCANAALEARLRGIDLSRSLGWTPTRIVPEEAV